MKFITIISYDRSANSIIRKALKRLDISFSFFSRREMAYQEGVPTSQIDHSRFILDPPFEQDKLDDLEPLIDKIGDEMGWERVGYEIYSGE